MKSAALMVVVHSPDATAGDPQFTATVDRIAGILRADQRVVEDLGRARVLVPLSLLLELQ